MNRQIILIGGAPTTGKSTIASLLSKHLNLPWISTDQIREVMRAVVDEEKFPSLFEEKNYTAETFLTNFTPEQIAAMEMEQSKEVWQGVRAFIKKDFTWPDGFIVEGVNILPSLVHQDFSQKPNVRAVFLVDEDADRIRNVVYNRGLWSDAKDYSDDVKEKEVEWVQLFNHKLKTEAEEFEMSWVEVQKHNNDMSAVLKVLDLE